MNAATAIEASVTVITDARSTHDSCSGGVSNKNKSHVLLSALSGGTRR
jgi:hypothetical protein